MDFKERLIFFAREQYNMGMTRFEQYTDVSSGLIAHMSKGISTVNLAKIAEKCPELNLRWLLLGEGEMIEQKDAMNGYPTDIASCIEVIKSMQQTISALLNANKA